MNPFTLLILVTSILMISACGLSAPPVYNRLSQFLSRIRSFDHHKYELLKNFQDGDDDQTRMLLLMLDSQISQVVTKANIVRKGLYCLLSSIVAFVLCFLFVEATAFANWMGFIAAGMGIVGISLFFWGVRLTMPELNRALPPLEEELAYLEIVRTHQMAKRQRWIRR